MILLADLETDSSSRRSAAGKAVFRKNRKSTNPPATAGEKAKSLVPPEDPYGRVTKLSGSLASDFQYAGYYEHATSGLNLTKYRAYDPNTGKWLSRDPIGEHGGINLYGYVVNNPIERIDLNGEYFVVIFAILALIGTAAALYDDTPKLPTPPHLPPHVEQQGPPAPVGPLFMEDPDAVDKFFSKLAKCDGKKAPQPDLPEFTEGDPNAEPAPPEDPLKQPDGGEPENDTEVHTTVPAHVLWEL